MEAWKSQNMYQHPEVHRPGTSGHIHLLTTGVYTLACGAASISCPQAWAAEIHQREADAAQREEEELEVRAPRKEQRGDPADPTRRRR